MVGDEARHHVGLLDRVAVVQRGRCARRQRIDDRALALGERRALQLVVNRDVGQRQVAGVGDADRVVDRLALLQQVAGCHVAGLGDDELRVGSVDLLVGAVATDSLGILAGRRDVFAALRVLDGIGLGGRDVLISAGDDVGLADHVRGRELLGLAHRQRRDGLVQAGLLVGYLDVGVRHVALVGDGHGVGNGVA